MMNQLLYLKNVVTLRLDEEKCVGCGMCLLVCPRAVLGPTDGKIEIVNRDACMECGACARNCPADALSVRPGVGCAVAVINSKLKRKNASTCCTIDSEQSSCSLPEGSGGTNRTGCC